jgi:MFS family permease
MLAAFGAYFCMYAFRKPFNAGTYSGMELSGIDYKSVLIISQAIGYMLSKFIGIKIISELKAVSRNKLIIALILVAEAALLLFGLVPYPYNFLCLFLNGLPLGMVWGVVFSYLEGRRFTEILAMGLSTSLIVSSGYLKTIYFYVHEWLPFVTEFWLPFVIGLLFLPLFLLFVWMLSVIPAPDAEDIKSRSPRLPMSNEDKRNVFRDYGIGLVLFVIVYAMLATLRDFRDSFSVEIWNETEPGWNKTVFAKTESVAGIVVLIAVALLSAIKNNRRAFAATNALVVAGLGLSGISTLLFHTHLIGPFWWMLLVGTGLFLAYIPFQVVMFERMIALFRIKANAGFFVYICDAIGYLGSVLLLLYKNFFMKDTSWSNLLVSFTYAQTIISIALMAFAVTFFFRKNKTLTIKPQVSSI